MLFSLRAVGGNRDYCILRNFYPKTGSALTLFLVAAKIALHSAGASGGTGGSPAPVGAACPNRLSLPPIAVLHPSVPCASPVYLHSSRASASAIPEDLWLPLPPVRRGRTRWQTPPAEH